MKTETGKIRSREKHKMKDEKKTELKDEKLEKVTGGVDTGMSQNGKQPEGTGKEPPVNTEYSAVDINGLEIIGPYPYS